MSKNLKTTILVAAGVAFTLASCSEDETIAKVSTNPGERQEIEFTLDMMSRATDRTITNLDTIWVYADDGAAEVFPATAFIKNEYGYFKPKTKIYWPDDKENVNFTAFWPSPDKLSEDPCGKCTDPMPGINFAPGSTSINAEAAEYPTGMFDLLTATKQMSKEDYKGTIALNFTHAFSQVDIKVKQGATADHKVEIYGYNLVHKSYKSNYSFTDDSWTFTRSVESNLMDVPDEVITVGEEPVSILSVKNQIYLAPATWNFKRFDLKKALDTHECYLMLYAKVYDENGEVIFPTEADKDVKFADMTLTRVPDEKAIGQYKDLRDISDCGVMFIQLGKDNLETQAGTKYVFNIDFTFGAGYYSEQDPNSPFGPILKNPICAEVTVEDWTSTELDDMEQN